MLIDGGRLVAYGPTNSILKSQKDLLKEIEWKFIIVTCWINVNPY
jgi:hypothetical protein